MEEKPARKLIAFALAPALGLPLIGVAAKAWMRRPRQEKPRMNARKIACVGDSITFGAGVLRQRRHLAWPYLLEQKLGTAWQVLNYGIIGATAQREAQVVFQSPRDLLDAAIKAQPELFLVMLGTNDAKTVNWNEGSFLRDYNGMLDRIQAGCPHAKLVLMTPASAFPNPKAKDGAVGFGIDADYVHKGAAPAVRQIARERELPLIDIHELTAGHPDWFVDGIHPNAEGNRALADAVYTELNRRSCL